MLVGICLCHVQGTQKGRKHQGYVGLTHLGAGAGHITREELMRVSLMHSRPSRKMWGDEKHRRLVEELDTNYGGVIQA